MVIYLHIVYSHCLSNDAELSSHNRDHRVAHKAKKITIWSLQKKFAGSYL